MKMKSILSTIKIFILLVSVCLVGVSCTTENTDKKEVQATTPPSVIQVENPQHSSLPQEGELAKERVCMVNNAYMGKKQIPVAYENKTYYGCCEMCVEKIKTNKAVRYAKDPQTGKEVDKATAFIALNPVTKDGSVLYFESEQSFKKYKDQEVAQ